MQAALKTSIPSVSYAMVDCASESKISEQFEFGRWPSVSVFKGRHNIVVYDGAWKALE
jgi:hypothetical protein